MKIREIHYNEKFRAQFKALPKHMQKIFLEKEIIFRENPFHPSLRLHKLKGKLEGRWSFSVNRSYRVLFSVMDDGNYVLVSVGTHAIYEFTR